MAAFFNGNGRYKKSLPELFFDLQRVVFRFRTEPQSYSSGTKRFSGLDINVEWTVKEVRKLFRMVLEEEMTERASGFRMSLCSLINRDRKLYKKFDALGSVETLAKVVDSSLEDLLLYARGGTDVFPKGAIFLEHLGAVAFDNSALKQKANE